MPFTAILRPYWSHRLGKTCISIFWIEINLFQIRFWKDVNEALMHWHLVWLLFSGHSVLWIPVHVQSTISWHADFLRNICELSSTFSQKFPSGISSSLPKCKLIFQHSSSAIPYTKVNPLWTLLRKENAKPVDCLTVTTMNKCQNHQACFLG